MVQGWDAEAIGWQMEGRVPPQRDEWEMNTVPGVNFFGLWPRISKPDGRYVALHGLPLFVLVLSGSFARKRGILRTEAL